MFIWTEKTYIQATTYFLPQTPQQRILHFSIFEGRGITDLSGVSKNWILVLQRYSHEEYLSCHL